MKNYNPKIHHRRSIRLKGYDYSQEGQYFITLVCEGWLHLFGKITNGEMIMNDTGRMIEKQWLELPNRFPNIVLREYVVMPNHFHAILEIIPPITDNIYIVNNPANPNVRAALVAAQNPFAENIDNPENNNCANNAENNNCANNFVNPKPGQPQGIAPTMSNGNSQPENKTVGDMMDAFKSITTVEYIRGVKTLGWRRFNGKIWQRNYYERIIRNFPSYKSISKYILNNPVKWNDDKLNNNKNHRKR